MGRGSFPLEQRGYVRDASDSIGIGQQAVMQIVEMQDGEFVDGALAAATKQEKDGS